MKPLLLSGVLLIAVSLFAQDDSTYKPASKASQEYHKLRIHLSYPPYSADKINLMVRKQVITDSEDNLVLRDKAYNALTLKEKFTYNMIHGESFNQNCAAFPPIQEEQKKIFAYLPDVFNEFAWSERQSAFFTDHKDSVLALIKECISKNNRVGVNFKEVIIDINGKEMIPLLIKVYNLTKKDHDILTVLMLLMKNAKYEPFLSTVSYKKLYGDDSNYQAYLVMNTANEQLVIKRAMDFYNAKGN